MAEKAKISDYFHPQKRTRSVSLSEGDAEEPQRTVGATDKEDYESDSKTTVTTVSDLTLFEETESLQSTPSEASSSKSHYNYETSGKHKVGYTLTGKRSGLGCCSEMVKACFVVCALIIVQGHVLNVKFGSASFALSLKGRGEKAF